MSAEVRNQVRNHYAELARKALQGPVVLEEASCCGEEGSSCCSPVDTIPVSALEALGAKPALPDDIVQTTLGCGTPLELARLQPGETVLDLGSGGGLDCFFAAQLVGPTGHVIGVDMTPEMLELANRNKARLGLTYVEFRQGVLENLPVEDASVDVIISNCVINLAADKDAVFREAFRVLKPGGRVALSDMIANWEMPETLRKNVQSWSACVSGAIPAAQYTAGLERAGLENVIVHCAPEPKEIVSSARFSASKPG